MTQIFPEQVQVKLLSADAKVPLRATPNSAGFDLYSARDTVIPASGKAIVPLDISVSLPAGTYGRIAPRSSLAAKNHLDVGAGVIDADYRGPVGVVMFNFGQTDYAVAKGDRVAQLVVERIWTGELTLVDELEDSVRGAGGFGSTGRN